jgi:hypothetical protein
MFLDINFNSGEVFYHSTKNIFDYIPAVTGLLTAYIAWRIYRNYDAKKIFIKLQIEEVIKFQNLLENTKFFIRVTGLNGNIKPYFLFIHNFDDVVKNPEQFSDLFLPAPLVVSYYSYIQLEFLKYADFYTIPKSIRNEIKDLNKFNNLDTVFLSKMGMNVYLNTVDDLISRNKSLQDNFVEQTFIIKSEHFTDFQSFFNKIMKIRRTVNEYLRNYDIDN